MTPNNKFILAGVAAATLGLAAAGAIAARGDWHSGRHGHRQIGAGSLSLGIGSPIQRLCRGNAAEMADHMLVRIEHRVKPTEAQKGPFEEFKTAARAAAAKVAAACPKTPEGEKATEGASRPDPVQRLAETQESLEASLDALKTVRPAAEKFYASLSDEQKAKLNAPRRERRGDRRPGGRGEAGKPAPEGAQQ